MEVRTQLSQLCILLTTTTTLRPQKRTLALVWYLQLEDHASKIHYNAFELVSVKIRTAFCQLMCKIWITINYLTWDWNIIVKEKTEYVCATNQHVIISFQYRPISDKHWDPISFQRPKSMDACVKEVWCIGLWKDAHLLEYSVRILGYVS